MLLEKQIFQFNEKSAPVFERISVFDFSILKNFLQLNRPYLFSIYCFILIEDGEIEIDINGHRTELRRGELACAIPGDRLIVSSLDKTSAKVIFFESDFILAALKGGFSLEPICSLNSDYHYPFIALSERWFGRLHNLAVDMEECLNEHPVFLDLLRTQLWQFIFLSEKEYIKNGNQGRKKDATKNHIPSFINLVNRYFRENHDVGFYAEKMNITPNYLNKIIKASLNVNAREYILNRIISEAKLLLRLTDINVNELAFKLGFDNDNYFIRLFKRIEGCTPGEYQKRGSL